MAEGETRQLADALYDAGQSGKPIQPFGTELESRGIAGAYAVQEQLTRRAELDGRWLVGRKIGLTSAAVQSQLGVSQPDYGMLFADMERAEFEEISTRDFISPKVEAEIAFIVGKKLDNPGLSLGGLIAAIAYALPAIEIVDSRIADWNISILDTVADNASSGAYVLGGSPVKVDALDLHLCGMVMEQGGEPVSTGCGTACLGNPLNAALWLARVMVEAGRPLNEGDIILSGALGPMVAVTPGAAYHARINGLGNVTARFAEDSKA